VDIALPYRYARRVPAGEDRLAVVDTYLVGPAGDSLTRATTVRFAQLDRLPLILPSAPNALRVLLDQLARRKGISLSVMIEADSLPLQKEITADSGCYTVLPLHAVFADVKAGRLQAAQIVNPGIERTIVIGTTTQRPLSTAAREIGKLISTLVADLAGTGAWQHLRR
jgi:DNA-binding transcriptional LysR family regulator